MSTISSFPPVPAVRRISPILGFAGLPFCKLGCPLGVCLGHQGIADCFGGNVSHAPLPVHGKVSDVVHRGDPIFFGVNSPFPATRYHSLCVNGLSEELAEIAWADDGVLMGIRHRFRPIWGLQFHPESVSTPDGLQILRNFRDITKNDQTASNRSCTVTSSKNSQSERKVIVRKVNVLPNAMAVFKELYGDSDHAFWLDSSMQVPSTSRFSFMGDASGPLSEIVSYSILAKEVTVESAGKTETHEASFFDYMDSRLRAHELRTPDLPFDFNLGYVGYLGYELKSECGGVEAHNSSTPDAYLIFADRCVVFDTEDKVCFLLALSNEYGGQDVSVWLRDTEQELQRLSRMPEDREQTSCPDSPRFPTNIERFRHSKQEYISLVNRCLQEIRDGESYEICLTNYFTTNLKLNALSTYAALRRLNPAPYSALLRFPGISVLSSSPERFLKISEERIVESKPIKGTRRRGIDPVEDQKLKENLLSSEKDRSENLMIVDLVRNDLNGVCESGSVNVRRLFGIESFSTVHQMVSTIRGKLRSDVSSMKCVQAAFPGGSMTGAPKVRTMEIIDRLEEGPRGIYSGALGYFALNGAVDLSIVIRTLVIEEAELGFGVGGAVVVDSDPLDEFEETLLKAKALREAIEIARKG